MFVAFTWEKGLLCRIQSMMITQNIDIKSSQLLTMTPRLQQAIKLLQMSNQEVALYVTEQLQENPLLMQAEESGVFTSDLPLSDSGLEGDRDEYSDRDSLIYDIRGSDSEFPHKEIQSTVDLRDYLLQQLAICISDPVEYKIGEYFIYNINENGYLDVDLDEVSESFNVSVSKILETLNKLQKFDPPGIFARNLAECFSLQLREKQLLRPEMERLLTHLNLLLSEPLAKVAKAADVTVDYCRILLDQLKTLNPRPIDQFSFAPLEMMIPDVYVYRHGNEWSVSLNTDVLPDILVNSNYFNDLQKHLSSKGDREYLNAKKSHANWLIQALHQRSTSILKVAAEIIAYQKDFLEQGISHLKPLTLHQIAETLGMHESTVSRITTAKYIATPRGVFDFKFFFSAAVGQKSIISIDNENVTAARSIQSRIESLIQKESRMSPLSDDSIVVLLENEGIVVARRTVAKYRKLLSIPSSVERRRFYEINNQTLRHYPNISAEGP